MNLGTDLFLLLRILVAGFVLWLLPWLRPAQAWFPEVTGAGRTCVAFAFGVFANVIGSYLLAMFGVYSPSVGLLFHIALALCIWIWSKRSVPRHPDSGRGAISGWGIGLAAMFALFLRLPDPLTHEALGGNDPWGHLVLCKALAGGDLISSFHFFGYYPRGFHFLIIALSRLTGGSIYEVMRLSGPILSLIGIMGAYAVARRVSSPYGGLIAAFVYAIPPYRHLTLPALQTALEPDRFSFVLLPALILILIEMIDRRSFRYGLFLALGGFTLVLIHPLSVQFLVGWMLLAGLVTVCFTRDWRHTADFAALAVVIVLFSWAYYRVMHSAYGLTPMPHVSPNSIVTIGGHGVDLNRLVFGTGFKVELMDYAGATLALLLATVAFLRREPLLLFSSLVLLHTLWAATTDALYIGDFGHAPPYYALAFVWAAGAFMGHRLMWGIKRLTPLVLIAGVLISSPFSTEGSLPVKLSLLGVLACGALLILARKRLVDLLVPLLMSVAFFALRPVPVTYAHLGYPESIHWARKLLACPPGTVYSLGLLSRLPDGRPFPTQDPVASIVWPTHTPKRIEDLVRMPPDVILGRGRHGYLLLERVPYNWSFPYYSSREREKTYSEGWEWLAARRDCGAPAVTLARSNTMILVALHSPEADECQRFLS